MKCQAELQSCRTANKEDSPDCFATTQEAIPAQPQGEIYSYAHKLTVSVSRFSILGDAYFNGAKIFHSSRLGLSLQLHTFEFIILMKIYLEGRILAH